MFIWKYKSFLLLGRKCERERDREEGFIHRLMEDCYIDLFLTPLWIYTQGLSSLLLWWEVLNGIQLGAICALLPCTHWLLWFLLTDSSVCGYLCLYNFLMPSILIVLPAVNSCDLLLLFFVYTARTYCFRNH